LQLIACPGCHTQYDVSQVITDTISCRCGELLENKPLSAVDARMHRCGSCGAQLTDQTGVCEFCGSEVVQDSAKLSLICPECYARNTDASRFCTACGVGFSPEEIPSNGREFPCPACSALMPSSQVAGVGINECGGCNGLWIPGDNFNVLVSRAADARRSAQEAGEPVEEPRYTGHNPAQQRVQYRKCPECDAFMHRRNYRKSSGIIVDVCSEHGTWLDADEMERIAGFILSGGRTSPMLEREQRSARADVAAAAALARMNVGRGSNAFTRGRHADSDILAEGLLGILTRILS
jgi:Zn-finger nucleic acid-binding protein